MGIACTCCDKKFEQQEIANGADQEVEDISGESNEEGKLEETGEELEETGGDELETGEEPPTAAAVPQMGTGAIRMSHMRSAYAINRELKVRFAETEV